MEEKVVLKGSMHDGKVENCNRIKGGTERLTMGEDNVCVKELEEYSRDLYHMDTKEWV